MNSPQAISGNLSSDVHRSDLLRFLSVSLGVNVVLLLALPQLWQNGFSSTLFGLSLGINAIFLVQAFLDKEVRRKLDGRDWGQTVGISLALAAACLSAKITDSAGVFTVMVAFSITSYFSVQLGSLVIILTTLPFFISSLAILSQSAIDTPYIGMALYAVGYAVFLYRAVKTGEVPSEAEMMEEIAQLQAKLNDAYEGQAMLSMKLQKQEESFDHSIKEQTVTLLESNKQLSQQILLRKNISDALVKSQTRLTQAIDASQLGLIDWDLDEKKFYQSAFHKYFGEKEQSVDQVITKLKEVTHPRDYQTLRETLNDALQGKTEHYTVQYRVKNPDQEDTWIWIEECGKVVETGADNAARKILGTRRNIQSDVARDEQVRLAKAVFDNTSEGVIVMGQTGKIISVNDAYKDMIQLSQEELIGTKIQTLRDTANRAEVFQQIFEEADKNRFWQGELLEKKTNGDYFPQRLLVNSIHDEQGELKYYAAIVTDLTDRRAADDKVDYLLHYDDLTQLANRTQFQNLLHMALMRYKDFEKPFSIVFLDIDRFKHFNDSFGHKAADSLLVDVARRLSDSVQKVDILARVGGNEFACLVERSSTFDSHNFAKRLFKAVTDNSYEIDGQEVMLSVSIGIIEAPEDGQEIDKLLRYGALAVQKAKFDGGNQIKFFDPSLMQFSRRRLEMEQGLRRALTAGELDLHYQPKLDLKTKKIESFEALLRWNHPSLGLISPEEFVDIAEENGLIQDIGAFALSRACEQTQAWIEQGYGSLNVSVNLSARQLRDANLGSLIDNTIEATGIAPQNLELELTESSLMDDAKRAITFLGAIRERGIRVSVDDFGTGYSSLSYLRDLPVDALKIDRGFVENIEQISEQQAIVKAIVVLGSHLNLKVVAEGVENAAQMLLLEGIGCDQVQGYYVSKPLSAEDMEKVLAAQQD